MSKRNKKISFSIIISLLTLIASFLTSFLFTKFLLSQPQIGDINYGLKTTADSFVSFVSVFTFGMSSTFIRFHKKYQNDEEKIFSSFNLITTIIAFIAIVFGIILCILTLNHIILDPAKGVYTEKQVYDFFLILVISISFTALSIVLGNSKWYLESTKHIVLVRIVNLIVVIMYSTISFILVKLGSNMVVVTLIYALTYLCGFLFYLFYRIKKVKTLNFLKFKNLDKQILKEIILFTFFVVVTSSIEVFNHSADKLILTITLTASLTTLYQLGITLNQVLLSLADLFYAPYLPYLAEDIIREDKKKIQSTYNHVTFLLLFISFLIFTGFAACGNEFVYLWVGEDKEIVYYFATLLFATWPLYGMAKFSVYVHRLHNKHYKSAIIYLVSFILHLLISFSFIKLIGIWACIIGTTLSMVFLGVAFIFYNKKELDIKQNTYLKNLFLLFISSIITLLINQFLSIFLTKVLKLDSYLLLLFIKGFVSAFLFLLLSLIIYWKKFKIILLTTFSDTYSIKNYGQKAKFSLFVDKLEKNKKIINKLFPYVFIVYFLFNFASYYLGGITIINSIVSSPIFTYGTKFVSYLILILYGLIFYFSNRCQINKKYIFYYLFVFSISIVSTILIPKSVTFVGINDYRWTVRTIFNIGIIDLIIGNINFLIDLIIMFFYVFIFRQVVVKKDLLPFFKFIVFFTLIEILYSLVFQINDYLFLLKKATDSSEFTGYSTNLSATFASKNGFGFLLFQAVLANYYLIKFNNRFNKLYFIPFVIINIVNVFSLCKTSIISSIVFILILLASKIIILRKNNKKVFITVLICCLTILLLLVLSFTPLFRKIPLIDKIISQFIQIFFISGRATIKSRIILWLYALKLVKGPYIILGYGKLASASFLNISSNFITKTFHNGFLDILCSFGIFGILLYFHSIKYSYLHNISTTKSKLNKLLLISVIVTTLLYGMMENVYLLISSSSVVLVPNLILATSIDTTHCIIKEKEFSYVQIKI